MHRLTQPKLILAYGRSKVELMPTGKYLVTHYPSKETETFGSRRVAVAVALGTLTDYTRRISRI